MKVPGGPIGSTGVAGCLVGAGVWAVSGEQGVAEGAIPLQAPIFHMQTVDPELELDYVSRRRIRPAMDIEAGALSGSDTEREEPGRLQPSGL
jgi:hypothetical protein